jgi:hypothetical protein
MGDVLILPAYLTAARRDQPHQAFQQRGLTDAIAPQQAGDFALAGGKSTPRKIWLPP